MVGLYQVHGSRFVPGTTINEMYLVQKQPPNLQLK